ncbi:MAG TPA: hypothetical protein PLE92_08360, partial [Lentisphaeria bacterium]|nr:hypothetical protein [Lentisphaeria bacterium]
QIRNDETHLYQKVENWYCAGGVPLSSKFPSLEIKITKGTSKKDNVPSDSYEITFEVKDYLNSTSIDAMVDAIKEVKKQGL